MNRKKLNRVLGSLAMSTVGLSPALGASENPFQLKEPGTPSMVAEAGKPAEAKPDCPMMGMEGRCGSKMKGMMDSNKDGKISKEEFVKHHEQMFDMKDKNKDGMLDDTEMGQMPEMMKGMGGGMKHGPGGMEGMKQEPAASPKP